MGGIDRAMERIVEEARRARARRGFSEGRRGRTQGQNMVVAVLAAGICGIDLTRQARREKAGSRAIGAFICHDKLSFTIIRRRRPNAGPQGAVQPGTPESRIRWSMTVNEPHLILGIGELLWDVLPRGRDWAAHRPTLR